MKVQTMTLPLLPCTKKPDKGRNKLPLFSIISAVFITCAMSLPGSAFSAEEELILEEVIVTATKREVSVQDVPVAISVLSGGFLEESGLDDLADFYRSVPGVDYSTQGPGRNSITVRGISSFAGSPLVGTYINEVPVAGKSSPGIDVKTYDIERVEFLKGPQGTLYGEGSMGGTMRIITNKPNMEEFEGSARLNSYATDHSSDLSWGGDVMFSVPIVKDVLALRFVGMYRDEAGFIDNTLLGEKDVNTEESINGRLTAQWNATENLTVTGTAFWSSLESEGSFSANPDTLTQERGPNDYADFDYELYDLTFNYDFDWGQFTSATGYFDQDSPRSEDLIDLVPLINGAFAGLIEAGLMEPFTEVWLGSDNTEKVTSQEFRIVSLTDSPLQWTFGAFYRKRELGFNELGLAEPALVLEPPFFPPGSEGRSITQKETFEQYAVFGELEWSVTDSLTLIAGGRYTDEDVRFQNETFGIFFGLPPHFDPHPQDSSVNFTKFVPKFAFSWETSDDLMIYGSAAQGFRSGLINPNTIVVAPGLDEDDIFVDPEDLWAYELGAKSTLMGGRMQLNGAVFHNDWTDRQVVNLAPLPGGGFLDYVDNIGKAHTTGVELDLTFLVTEGLNLQLGGYAVEAEIDEPVFAFSGAGGGIGIAPKGNKLPGSSPYKYFLSADYSFSMSSEIEGFLRGSISRNGKYYFSVLNEDFDLTPAYTMLDLSAGFDWRDWQFKLFCGNCSDENVGISADANSSFLDRKFFMNKPRTIGLTVSAYF